MESEEVVPMDSAAEDPLLQASAPDEAQAGQTDTATQQEQHVEQEQQAQQAQQQQQVVEATNAEGEDVLLQEAADALEAEKGTHTSAAATTAAATAASAPQREKSVCGVEGCKEEVHEGIEKAVHLRRMHFDVYRKVYQPASYGPPQQKRRKDADGAEGKEVRDLSPDTVFKSTFLEKKRVRTQNEAKRSARRARAEDVNDVELTAEESDAKEKVVEDVIANPCYDEAGMAATFFEHADMDLLHEARLDRYCCPIRHCVKQYATVSGILYHMSKATCQATAEIHSLVEAQQRRMQEEYDNDPYKCPQHPHVTTDQGFPTYRWPQEEHDAAWWVPQLYARRFFDAKRVEEEHPELTRRTASVPEKLLMRKKNLIKPKALYRDIIVMRVDEVLHVLEHIYPERYAEYVRLVQGEHAAAAAVAKATPSAPAQVNIALLHLAAKPIAQLTANYNKALSYERREERKSFFDINTQITHYPLNKLQRVERSNALAHACGDNGGRAATDHNALLFPVAVMSGQYQHGFKILSSREEAEYLTPRAVPPAPKHVGMTVEDLLAAASSAAATTATAAAAGATTATASASAHSGAAGAQGVRPTSVYAQMKRRLRERPVVMKPPPAGATCGICLKGRDSNSDGVPEELITCSKCEACGHPSCLELSPELVSVVKTYKWECMECKLCTVCHDPNDEALLLFCDDCDRGYHTYCVGLSEPPNGRWICHTCGFCASCGAQDPAPPAAASASTASASTATASTAAAASAGAAQAHGLAAPQNWHYVYAGDASDEDRALVCTLCVPCTKYFEAGMFCPICLGVYRNNGQDPPMLCCSDCSRWVHARCDAIPEDAVADILTDPSQEYTCGICKGAVAERYDRFAKRKPKKDDKKEVSSPKK